MGGKQTATSRHAPKPAHLSVANALIALEMLGSRQSRAISRLRLWLPDAVASSARHANSMIAATKQSIFEMTFSASGSGSAGKANPNTAQTANTTNIPDTA